ncbi:hypothetical protein GQ53DRAFT_162043 [Thozetella sp. PMI_491]|nr:hypothetical protein GQ53DRAFT_162043 [Thozetella sp. PMI_491]
MKYLGLAPVFLALASAAVVPRSGAKAVYYLDNDPAGASIVSLQVDPQDGTLSNPVRTSTGGLGLLGNTAAGPAAADPLFSQGSVVVVNDRLLTVNPGSNTLALFRLDPNDPYHPALVGQPVSTGGTFPVSVAFSHALHIACVLNSGHIAGIACFHVDDNGLTPAGDFMPIALTVNQTTPPVGPFNTASEIVFNPSSSALFATVKGNPTTPGFIYAFPVRNGLVSPAPVVSRPPELLVDFALTFLNDSQAVIVDPSHGAAFLDVAYPSLDVHVAKDIVIQGQVAACWVEYSARFNAVFVFDAGRPEVVALDPLTGDIKYTIVAPPQTRGNFDSVVFGKYLYMLQGASGISVFTLEGSVGNGKTPSLVQNLDLTALGSRSGWIGMAAYPN